MRDTSKRLRRDSFGNFKQSVLLMLSLESHFGSLRYFYQLKGLCYLVALERNTKTHELFGRGGVTPVLW